MATLSVHDDISLISKGLYRIVSDIVGPECFIKIRRQGWIMNDDFINCNSYNAETTVTSGSRAEGFEFKSSDVDTMYIDRNAIVLFSSCPITGSYQNISTILIMENENITPGFAFIRCQRCDQNNTTLSNALVLKSNWVYVSSKQIRESFMSSSSSQCHGPCQTVNFLGIEGDRAYTLRCPVWPNQAMSFVYRTLRQGWPSYNTLTQICKDGCLLVPINSKQQQYSDMTDLQWRISFSLAEKKLVHSMNHCQFLCYGLSKVFLNEVLKKASPNEDVLCSYFMKTAVFWEILDSPSDWSPLNFLPKFWKVFGRLINWVGIGYCPNFFIPENNMFQGKIYGETQVTLLDTLRDLYMDGYWSLLRCPSLYEDLSLLITQPEIGNMVSCDELEYVPKSRIERGKLLLNLRFDIYHDVTQVETMKKTLMNILLMTKRESDEIISTEHLAVNHLLQFYGQNLFLSKKLPYLTNTRNYNDYKTAKSILWKKKTFFCMNYMILIKIMYMAGNYYKTVEMIHYTRHKLQSQPYMYEWTLDDDVIMAALQQGMSYDTVVKSLIVTSVKIDKDTTVKELEWECFAASVTNGETGLLFIPPLVYLNFFLILSYTRLDEIHLRHDVLNELHMMLQQNDGHHITITRRAISWEILGICQQLCGDRHGAYQSYLHALDDEYNHFKLATIGRISSLTSIGF